ncbi:membrane hypothetical protein [Hyella patelloides LEGE 07179]|uniref:Glycosyltransferase RgtA/B/C/D-like domain-containing protein n=1 Tax=Hyella patelloides LEGE 07179 TaxID=945734 RepID=A0A563VIJ2_9CYAN|nr:YfhO family protein [Hyella patelloides]VEP11256.1 membrane hypothetical protein [Hyella patelloides LEGE 07179]
MYKSAQSLEKITYIVLLITVILVASVKIWVLDKGFNITDEAYAVLGYEPLQERLEVVSAFHRIVYKLFGWLEPSLMAYRAIALVSTTLAASFFAISFYYWLNKIYQPKNQPFKLSFIILFLILGGFVLDYDRHNILNYDVINNALNITQASLVLILIAQEDSKILKSWKFKLGWLAVGFLATFQFLNKAPSAVMFTVFLGVLLILDTKNVNWQYYLRIVIYFVSGGLLGLLTYFVLFQNFWQYQELLSRQLSLMVGDASDTSYSVENIYSKDRDSSKIIRWEIIITIIGVYLTTFGLTKVYFSSSYLKHYRKTRLLSILLWLFATFVILALIQPLQWHLIKAINITVYYPLIFIFLLVILAASNNYFLKFKNYISFRKIIGVSSFLLLLPFGAAFGTNTSIRALAARNIIPWLAVILILLTLLYQNHKTKNFIYLFTLTIIVWLGIKISYSQIYHPYKLLENRLQQTELLEFVQPHARGLKVDPLTANFIEQLHNIVHQSGFQVGDPIIALHDMPGLVYLLGGFSPGAPWYFSVFPESPVRTCNNILHSSFNPKKAVFLINNDIDPLVLGCLKKVGINFPQDYHKVGEVENPFYAIRPLSKKTVTVWSSKENSID